MEWLRAKTLNPIIGNLDQERSGHIAKALHDLSPITDFSALVSAIEHLMVVRNPATNTRTDLSNPSDWVVMPLRRVIPSLPTDVWELIIERSDFLDQIALTSLSRETRSLPARQILVRALLRKRTEWLPIWGRSRTLSSCSNQIQPVWQYKPRQCAFLQVPNSVGYHASVLLHTEP